VDPAPGHLPELADKTDEEIGDVLMDTALSLFDRYTAMFALRNRGGGECVLQLARGFADESAVFRHEVAYVLGQMQHPAAIESLIVCLEDLKEHAMVRHEAAEALGAIDDERVGAL
jgi:deoxyhypusine monooxygenase